MIFDIFGFLLDIIGEKKLLEKNYENLFVRVQNVAKESGTQKTCE